VLDYDYCIVIIRPCELYIVELISWVDFCAGCSLRRFGWDERSIHFLARLLRLLD